VDRIGAEVGGDAVAFLEHACHPVTQSGGFDGFQFIRRRFASILLASIRGFLGCRNFLPLPGLGACFPHHTPPGQAERSHKAASVADLFISVFEA